MSVFSSLIAENEIDWLNTAYHIHPPLATMKDRDYILNAIKKKLISSLTSLHRPRSTSEKDGAFEWLRWSNIVRNISTLIAKSQKKIKDFLYGGD